MTDEIKPGFYWAKVYTSFKNARRNEPSLEIIEYVWYNKYSFNDEELENITEKQKEYEWMRCGSEVPIWPHDRIILLPHNGPLTPPPEPVDFEELEKLEPHQPAVDMVYDIKPVRDNGE